MIAKKFLKTILLCISLCIIFTIKNNINASEDYDDIEYCSYDDDSSSDCNLCDEITILDLQDISNRLHNYFNKSARMNFEFPDKKSQYIETTLKHRISRIIKSIDETLKNNRIDISNYLTVKTHLNFIKTTEISYLSSLREIIPELQKMSDTILYKLYQISRHSI